MLKIGDTVFDIGNGVKVQVLERIEAWGFVSYRVFNPAIGTVYKVTEGELTTGGNAVHYDRNYLRYVTLLAKIRNETCSRLLPAA